MKVYDDQKKLKQVVCNCCKRQLKVSNGILMEGIFEADNQFGYFSHKDGQRHRFDLCESCYDTWVTSFQLQVSVKECYEWQNEQQ